MMDSVSVSRTGGGNDPPQFMQNSSPSKGRGRGSRGILPSNTSEFSASDLCNNQNFVRKLLKKCRVAFSEVSAAGMIMLNDSFMHLDRSINSSNYEADLWTFKLFFRNTPDISDRELEVLFLLVDSAEGVVDLGDVMHFLRKTIGCKCQQFHDIIRRLRGNRAKIGAVPQWLKKKKEKKQQKKKEQKKKLRGGEKGAEGHHENNADADEEVETESTEDSVTTPTASSSSAPLPTRAEVFEFLTSRSCQLTQSEAFLVLEHCTIADEGEEEEENKKVENSNNNGGGGGKLEDPNDDEDDEQQAFLAEKKMIGELDLDYLRAAMFDFPMPSEIAYPLLLGKFCEALSNIEMREVSGTVGILRACGLLGDEDKLRQVLLESTTASGSSMGSVGIRTPSKGTSCYRGREIVAAGTPSEAQDIGGEQRSHHHHHGGGGGRADPNRHRMLGAGTSHELQQQQQTQRRAPSASATYWKQGYDDAELDYIDFRKFVNDAGAGLSTAEADLFFSFICDTERNVLPIKSLISIFEERLERAAEDDINNALELIRSQIVLHNNFGGLCDLHLMLVACSSFVSVFCPQHSERMAAERGTPAPKTPPPTATRTTATTSNDTDDRIPLTFYTAALRACGVSREAVSDVMIQHVYNATGSTGAATVLSIRGTISSARENTIRKLFEKLDSNDDGLISRLEALDLFFPEALEVNLESRPQDRVEMFAQYIMSLPAGDEQMSYAEFAYFWGNVSISIQDENTFQMLLWKSFGMEGGKGKLSMSRFRSNNPNSSVVGSSVSVRRGGAGTSASAVTPRRALQERLASKR